MHLRRRDVEFMDELASILDDKPNGFAFLYREAFGFVEVVAHRHVDRARDF